MNYDVPLRWKAGFYESACNDGTFSYEGGWEVLKETPYEVSI